MQANHSIKRCLFEYYSILSITAFLLAFLLLTFGFLDWKALIIIEGGILSFAFSVQKQQLEEVRLFKELFSKFNERYDAQNDNLNHIYLRHQRNPELAFDESEIVALFNYFNLCAEEYLYFKQGFIYPEVWQAWKNGMKFFRQNHKIQKLWDEELKTDSYYGLSFEY